MFINDICKIFLLSFVQVQVIRIKYDYTSSCRYSKSINIFLANMLLSKRDTYMNLKLDKQTNVRMFYMFCTTSAQVASRSTRSM